MCTYMSILSFPLTPPTTSLLHSHSLLQENKLSFLKSLKGEVVGHFGCVTVQSVFDTQHSSTISGCCKSGVAYTSEVKTYGLLAHQVVHCSLESQRDILQVSFLLLMMLNRILGVRREKGNI